MTLGPPDPSHVEVSVIKPPSGPIFNVPPGTLKKALKSEQSRDPHPCQTCVCGGVWPILAVSPSLLKSLNSPETVSWRVGAYEGTYLGRDCATQPLRRSDGTYPSLWLRSLSFRLSTGGRD